MRVSVSVLRVRPVDAASDSPTSVCRRRSSKSLSFPLRNRTHLSLALRFFIPVVLSAPPPARTRSYKYYVLLTEPTKYDGHNIISNEKFIHQRRATLFADKRREAQPLPIDPDLTHPLPHDWRSAVPARHKRLSNF